MAKEPEAEYAENMYSVLSRIEELFPKYITEDSTIDLLCSLSINQIYETCAQNPPLSLDGFRQSAFDALGLENSESLVEKEPRISAEELPLERLTEALGKLAEDYEISDKEWESGRAIGKVLLEIAKRTPRYCLKHNRTQYRFVALDDLSRTKHLIILLKPSAGRSLETSWAR